MRAFQFINTVLLTAILVILVTGFPDRNPDQRPDRPETHPRISAVPVSNDKPVEHTHSPRTARRLAELADQVQRLTDRLDEFRDARPDRVHSRSAEIVQTAGLDTLDPENRREIELSLADGHISVDESDRVLETMSRLNISERAAVLRHITREVNAGRLEVDPEARL